MRITNLIFSSVAVIVISAGCDTAAPAHSGNQKVKTDTPEGVKPNPAASQKFMKTRVNISLVQNSNFEGPYRQSFRKELQSLVNPNIELFWTSADEADIAIFPVKADYSGGAIVREVGDLGAKLDCRVPSDSNSLDDCRNRPVNNDINPRQFILVLGHRYSDNLGYVSKRLGGVPVLIGRAWFEPVPEWENECLSDVEYQPLVDSINALSLTTQRETKPDINGFNRGIHKDTQEIYGPDGYDIKGFDRNGFDTKGDYRDGSKYDQNGFDVARNHKSTGTRFDTDGFDAQCYSDKGFDPNGIHKKTLCEFDHTGLDKNGYDREGFDSRGHHKETGNQFAPNGLDKNGYDREGFDSRGHHKETGNRFAPNGRDKNGYDKGGFDSKGDHKETGNRFAPNGRDKNGYDKEGFDSKGDHKETGNRFAPNGRDKNGYDKGGFDSKGDHKETGNRFAPNGRDKDGCDDKGFDSRGDHKETGSRFAPNGRDKNGYDKFGFGEDGIHESGSHFDSSGFNALREHKLEIEIREGRLTSAATFLELTKQFVGSWRISQVVIKNLDAFFDANPSFNEIKTLLARYQDHGCTNTDRKIINQIKTKTIERGLLANPAETTSLLEIDCGDVGTICHDDPRASAEDEAIFLQALHTVERHSSWEQHRQKNDGLFESLAEGVMKWLDDVERLKIGNFDAEVQARLAGLRPLSPAEHMVLKIINFRAKRIALCVRAYEKAQERLRARERMPQYEYAY